MNGPEASFLLWYLIMSVRLGRPAAQVERFVSRMAHITCDYVDYGFCHRRPFALRFRIATLRREYL